MKSRVFPSLAEVANSIAHLVALSTSAWAAGSLNIPMSGSISFDNSLDFFNGTPASTVELKVFMDHPYLNHFHTKNCIICVPNIMFTVWAPQNRIL